MAYQQLAGLQICLRLLSLVWITCYSLRKGTYVRVTVNVCRVCVCGVWVCVWVWVWVWGVGLCTTCSLHNKMISSIFTAL